MHCVEVACYPTLLKRSDLDTATKSKDLKFCVKRTPIRMKQSARIFHLVGLLSLLTAIALTISPDQLGKSDVENPHEISPIVARQLAVYRLFFKEEAVGRLSLEMIPQGNGSTLVVVQNEMKLVAFGQPINFGLKLNAKLNDEQQLMSTTFELTSEGFVIQGSGRVLQNTLGLNLKVGDIEKKLRIPFDQRTTLSALWHEKEAVKKMKPGDVLELKLLIRSPRKSVHQKCALWATK